MNLDQDLQEIEVLQNAEFNNNNNDIETLEVDDVISMKKLLCQFKIFSKFQFNWQIENDLDIAVQNISIFQYEAGEPICFFGELTEYAYFFVSGKVAVYVKKPQQKIDNQRDLQRQMDDIQIQIDEGNITQKLRQQHFQVKQILDILKKSDDQLIKQNKECYERYHDEYIQTVQRVREIKPGIHYGGTETYYEETLVAQDTVQCIAMNQQAFNEIFYRLKDNQVFLENLILKVFPMLESDPALKQFPQLFVENKRFHGEHLFYEGEDVDKIYVLHSGKIEIKRSLRFSKEYSKKENSMVKKEDESKEKTLMEITQPLFFGHEDLTDRKRTISVKIISGRCKLFTLRVGLLKVLPKIYFDELNRKGKLAGQNYNNKYKELKAEEMRKIQDELDKLKKKRYDKKKKFFSQAKQMTSPKQKPNLNLKIDINNNENNVNKFISNLKIKAREKSQSDLDGEGQQQLQQQLQLEGEMEGSEVRSQAQSQQYQLNKDKEFCEIRKKNQSSKKYNAKKARNIYMNDVVKKSTQPYNSNQSLQKKMRDKKRSQHSNGNSNGGGSQQQQGKGKGMRLQTNSLSNRPSNINTPLTSAGNSPLTNKEQYPNKNTNNNTNKNSNNNRNKNFEFGNNIKYDENEEDDIMNYSSEKITISDYNKNKKFSFKTIMLRKSSTQQEGRIETNMQKLIRENSVKSDMMYHKTNSLSLHDNNNQPYLINNNNNNKLGQKTNFGNKGPRKNVFYGNSNLSRNESSENIVEKQQQQVDGQNQQSQQQSQPEVLIIKDQGGGGGGQGQNIQGTANTNTNTIANSNYNLPIVQESEQDMINSNQFTPGNRQACGKKLGQQQQNSIKHVLQKKQSTRYSEADDLQELSIQESDVYLNEKNDAFDRVIPNQNQPQNQQIQPRIPIKISMPDSSHSRTIKSSNIQKISKTYSSFSQTPASSGLRRGLSFQSKSSENDLTSKNKRFTKPPDINSRLQQRKSLLIETKNTLFLDLPQNNNNNQNSNFSQQARIAESEALNELGFRGRKKKKAHSMAQLHFSASTGSSPVKFQHSAMSKSVVPNKNSMFKNKIHNALQRQKSKEIKDNNGQILRKQKSGIMKNYTQMDETHVIAEEQEFREDPKGKKIEKNSNKFKNLVNKVKLDLKGKNKKNPNQQQQKSTFQPKSKQKQENSFQTSSHSQSSFISSRDSIGSPLTPKNRKESILQQPQSRGKSPTIKRNSQLTNSMHTAFRRQSNQQLQSSNFGMEKSRKRTQTQMITKNHSAKVRKSFTQLVDLVNAKETMASSRTKNEEKSTEKMKKKKKKKRKDINKKYKGWDDDFKKKENSYYRFKLALQQLRDKQTNNNNGQPNVKVSQVNSRVSSSNLSKKSELTTRKSPLQKSNFNSHRNSVCQDDSDRQSNTTSRMRLKRQKTKHLENSIDQKRPGSIRNSLQAPLNMRYSQASIQSIPLSARDLNMIEISEDEHSGNMHMKFKNNPSNNNEMRKSQQKLQQLQGDQYDVTGEERSSQESDTSIFKIRRASDREHSIFGKRKFGSQNIMGNNGSQKNIPLLNIKRQSAANLEIRINQIESDQNIEKINDSKGNNTAGNNSQRIPKDYGFAHMATERTISENSMKESEQEDYQDHLQEKIKRKSMIYNNLQQLQEDNTQQQQKARDVKEEYKFDQNEFVSIEKQFENLFQGKLSKQIMKKQAQKEQKPQKWAKNGQNFDLDGDVFEDLVFQENSCLMMSSDKKPIQMHLHQQHNHQNSKRHIKTQSDLYSESSIKKNSLNSHRVVISPRVGWKQDLYELMSERLNSQNSKNSPVKNLKKIKEFYNEKSLKLQSQNSIEGKKKKGKTKSEQFITKKPEFNLRLNVIEAQQNHNSLSQNQSQNQSYRVGNYYTQQNSFMNHQQSNYMFSPRVASHNQSAQVTLGRKGQQSFHSNNVHANANSNGYYYTSAQRKVVQKSYQIGDGQGQVQGQGRIVRERKQNINKILRDIQRIKRSHCIKNGGDCQGEQSEGTLSSFSHNNTYFTNAINSPKSQIIGKSFSSAIKSPRNLDLAAAGQQQFVGGKLYNQCQKFSPYVEHINNNTYNNNKF